mmetsp:Transcript_60481/g.128197  ORF Transcript_60481/g.128197 Transcript_60481/m.128197 type:complete len:328 (+) Transcript_60481:837-1820(+)
MPFAHRILISGRLDHLFLQQPADHGPDSGQFSVLFGRLGSLLDNMQEGLLVQRTFSLVVPKWMEQGLRHDWFDCLAELVRGVRKVGEEPCGAVFGVLDEEARGRIPPSLLSNRALCTLDGVATQKLRSRWDVQMFKDLGVDWKPFRCTENHVMDAPSIRTSQKYIAGEDLQYVDVVLRWQAQHLARAVVAITDAARLAPVTRRFPPTILPTLIALHFVTTEGEHLSDDVALHRVVVWTLHQSFLEDGLEGLTILAPAQRHASRPLLAVMTQVGNEFGLEAVATAARARAARCPHSLKSSKNKKQQRRNWGAEMPRITKKTKKNARRK